MIRLNPLILLIVVWCTLAALPAAAQSEDRFEKIENQKVAYITKHLKLTPTEAQHFFPLYNQYSSSMRAVKSARSSLMSGNPGGASGDVIEFDAKEVKIKKQYRTKFAEVIGQSRASQFFVVEQEFKDMLYREWQSRKNK